MCFNCPTSCLDCIDQNNPSECCIGPSTAAGIEHIGVNYFDVTTVSGDNVLEFQDRGDCEYVHNAFLVVEAGKCGDVTGDGNVNAGDYFLLRGYVLGAPVTLNTWAADVNCDNNINAGDYFLLRGYVLGAPVTLNCCGPS